MSTGIFARTLCRQGVWTAARYRFPTISLSYGFTTTSSVVGGAKPQEDFWKKNKRLSRPMSPHLTIYQPQITWLLSITHRGTGLALSTMTSGLAIGMLTLPGSFPHYLNMLQASQYGPVCIFSAKLILAFPLMFHFCNGIRHLAWDLGWGFKNKQVSLTGWTVLGLSALLSVAAAAM